MDGLLNGDGEERGRKTGIFIKIIREKIVYQGYDFSLSVSEG